VASRSESADCEPGTSVEAVGAGLSLGGTAWPGTVVAGEIDAVGIAVDEVELELDEVDASFCSMGCLSDAVGERSS